MENLEQSTKRHSHSKKIIAHGIQLVLAFTLFAFLIGQPTEMLEQVSSELGAENGKIAGVFDQSNNLIDYVEYEPTIHGFVIDNDEVYMYVAYGDISDDLDPSPTTTFTLPQTGWAIVKLDANLNFVWARLLPFQIFDFDIVGDELLIGGQISATTDVDPTAGVDTRTISLFNDRTALLSRWDKNTGTYIGTTEIAKVERAYSSESVQEIAVTGDNSYYILVSILPYDSSVDLNPDPIGQDIFTLTGGSSYGGVIKFDQSHNYEWGILNHDSLPTGRTTRIDVDSGGNLIALGSLYTNTTGVNADVNDVKNQTYNLAFPTTYGTTMYYAKYNSDGTFAWANGIVGGNQLANSSPSDSTFYVNEIQAVPGSNDFIIAGQYKGAQFSFNTVDPASSLTNSVPDSDVPRFNWFIFRVDGNDGTITELLSTTSTNTLAESNVYGVEFDSNGNMFSLGTFRGTDLDFDNTIAVREFDANGRQDFVTFSDPAIGNGLNQFASTDSGVRLGPDLIQFTNNNKIQRIANSNSDILYISGLYGANGDLDYSISGSEIRTGDRFHYLAKYQDPTATPPTTTGGSGSTSTTTGGSGVSCGTVSTPILIRGGLYADELDLQRCVTTSEPAHIFQYDPRYIEFFREDLTSRDFTIREDL